MDSIKNVISFNTPAEYQDRQTRYMVDRSKRFARERAYLSGDYVKARVQGLKDNFYEYTETKIRLADVSTLNETALVTKKQDDYKRVLLPDRDYLPIGAKIETMGNVWVAINPANMSTALTTSIVARCNASFNYYDEYGNIKYEPIIIEHISMLGNVPQTPLNNMLMSGYFSVVCQLNDVTEKLSENSRIILGKKAYHITGYQDFAQEFTGNYESCHLCTFTVRVEEPVEDDDIPNRIANGLSRYFKIECDYKNRMTVDETQTITPKFIVDGNVSDLDIDWIFETKSDFIHINGNEITANGEGNATIVARMGQNSSLYQELDIEVTTDVIEPYIAVLDVVPNFITQYQKAKFKFAYFNEYNVQTDDPINFSFSGAYESSYSFKLQNNEVEIECIEADDKLLNINAEYNGYSKTIQIRLLGY